ncbi:hypothetical protein NM962_13245 [Mycobacterium sp. SVM_VP21]|nr:hypothetical protein NM962_13245 [Mycobacterium sp. SVM_VP21]
MLAIAIVAVIFLNALVAFAQEEHQVLSRGRPDDDARKMWQQRVGELAARCS